MPLNKTSSRCFHETETEISFFFVHGIITFGLIGIGLYLFHKTKLLHDIYGIRNELLFQCMGLCSALFLYIITTFIFSMAKSDPDMNRIEWLCHYIISIIISISIGLISTIYPVRFMKRKESMTMLTTVTPSNSEQEFKENLEYFRNSRAMEYIISDYDSFKQFMQYLVK